MRQIAISSEPPTQIVYIPHHLVFRAESTTTHLRVVFNASFITSNGTSLNDHLLAQITDRFTRHNHAMALKSLRLHCRYRQNVSANCCRPTRFELSTNSLET